MTITGHTRLAAVIGWPVEHSRSPQMMNAAFASAGIDAVLVPIAAPPAGLATVVHALRAMTALGASVTVPHKLAVAALCDEVTPQARAIGAVNCLRFVDHRVLGVNTDADGFARALATAGIDVRGRHVVVLGAGGAARAVTAGLRDATVEVVARTPAAWVATTPWADVRGPTHVTSTPWAGVADALARAHLVVDCTPIGLDPAAEPGFVDALALDRLRPGAAVATLVYHRTPLLLERAAALGHPVLDGSDMLVHQGALAFALWTGRDAPLDVMRRAVKSA